MLNQGPFALSVTAGGTRLLYVRAGDPKWWAVGISAMALIVSMGSLCFTARTYRRPDEGSQSSSNGTLVNVPYVPA